MPRIDKTEAQKEFRRAKAQEYEMEAFIADKNLRQMQALAAQDDRYTAALEAAQEAKADVDGRYSRIIKRVTNKPDLAQQKRDWLRGHIEQMEREQALHEEMLANPADYWPADQMEQQTENSTRAVAELKAGITVAEALMTEITPVAKKAAGEKKAAKKKS